MPVHCDWGVGGIVDPGWGGGEMRYSLHVAGTSREDTVVTDLPSFCMRAATSSGFL